MKNAIGEIKSDEGFRSNVYKCTAGADTIGYGYNLDANPLKLNNYELLSARKNGITETMANVWLIRMVEGIETKLSNALGCFDDLCDARKAVLISMAYQIGLVGLMQFKDTIKCLKYGDYELASINMLDSKWAKQTPARAHRLALQMKDGKFV